MRFLIVPSGLIAALATLIGTVSFSPAQHGRWSHLVS